MSVSISSPIGTSALRNPVAVGSNRSSILRMLEKSGGGGGGAELRDDPLMRAMRTNRTAEIGAIVSATSNIRDGATMLQIADEGLEDIGDKLDEMKSLAVTAKATGLSDRDRALLNRNFAALRAEIDDIAQTT